MMTVSEEVMAVPKSPLGVELAPVLLLHALVAKGDVVVAPLVLEPRRGPGVDAVQARGRGLDAAVVADPPPGPGRRDSVRDLVEFVPVQAVHGVQGRSGGSQLSPRGEDAPRPPAARRCDGNGHPSSLAARPSAPSVS